jgi:hypothetical protein
VAASVAAVLVAAASAAVFDKSSVYKLLRGDALWCRLSFFMYIISEYVAPLFLYVTITLYKGEANGGQIIEGKAATI